MLELLAGDDQVLELLAGDDQVLAANRELAAAYEACVNRRNRK